VDSSWGRTCSIHRASCSPAFSCRFSTGAPDRTFLQVFDLFGESSIGAASIPQPRSWRWGAPGGPCGAVSPRGRPPSPSSGHTSTPADSSSQRCSLKAVPSYAASAPSRRSTCPKEESQAVAGGHGEVRAHDVRRSRAGAAPRAANRAEGREVRSPMAGWQSAMPVRRSCRQWR
jgi:hypothetical protein